MPVGDSIATWSRIRWAFDTVDVTTSTFSVTSVSFFIVVAFFAWVNLKCFMKNFGFSKLRTNNLVVYRNQPYHLRTSWQHHYYHYNWHFQLPCHCSWRNSPCKQHSMMMLADRLLNIQLKPTCWFQLFSEIEILGRKFKTNIEQFSDLYCLQLEHIHGWNNIFSKCEFDFRDRSIQLDAQSHKTACLLDMVLIKHLRVDGQQNIKIPWTVPWEHAGIVTSRISDTDLTMIVPLIFTCVTSGWDFNGITITIITYASVFACFSIF